MAARRERGLFDPDAPEGESLFDHTIWAFASDGDLEEGVSGEASSLAGTQQLGNLVLVYDDNQISIEDDTERRLHRGRRQALRGLRLARAARATTARTSPPSTPRSPPPRPRPAARRSSCCARSSAGPRRTSRTPAPPTARRSATTRSRRPRRSSASTRSKTFEVAPEVIEHARKVVDRGQAGARRAGSSASTPGSRPTPRAPRCWSGCRTRTLPEGWADDAADLGRRPEGRGHPQGLRRGARRALPGAARAVGRLGRPGGEQQHRGQGRTVVPARRPADEDVVAAARTAAPCTSASASTPWARS